MSEIAALEILKRYVGSEHICDGLKFTCEGCNFTCENGEDCVQAGIIKLLGKLAAYEDAEADGRLMVPPCKVGNTAYRIDLDEIIEYTVKGFAGGEKIETVYLEYCYNGRTYGCSFDVESLYFTRAEAEAALKGVSK